MFHTSFDTSKDKWKTPASIGAIMLLGSPFLAIFTWFGAFLAAIIGAVLCYHGVNSESPASGICPNCGKPWEKEETSN